MQGLDCSLRASGKKQTLHGHVSAPVKCLYSIIVLAFAAWQYTSEAFAGPICMISLIVDNLVALT